jgi:hypothetical protein
MEPYRSHFHMPVYSCRTEALVERVIDLPTGTGVSAQEIEKICLIIRTAVAEAETIMRWPLPDSWQKKP